jgi:hypothetical protein
MIGDVLLIYQIKERRIDRRLGAAEERIWFNRKVLGTATKQVRDTLSYLETYPEIWVPNERGHPFNLAARKFKEIIKIVVYAPSPNLPSDCRKIHSHLSTTAGLIHIIDAHDYLELSRTLRVPQEVIQYFKFRESVLTQFPDACASVTEAAIAGHFIVGDRSAPPTMQAATRLRDLVQDSTQWDLAPLLRTLHDHLTSKKVNAEYYDILLEFMKLPRSAWRMAKERFILCYENARNDEFARPYRMVFPETDCGFVFVPIQSQFVQAPDWPIIRDRAIENMTRLHKYDQHLSTCVGYLIGKDGDYLDTNWCLLRYEWEEDPSIQRILDEQSPFRPVSEAAAYGYYAKDSSDTVAPKSTT